MSIEKYTTPVFIVKHYESGEDNIIIKAWSREFGLIFIKAQSIRKSSKLKQHCLEGRISNLTLVKGKEYYRLAGAREIIYEDKYVKIICSIIQRLIHGEENIYNLFDKYISYLEFIKTKQKTNNKIDKYKANNDQINNTNYESLQNKKEILQKDKSALSQTSFYLLPSLQIFKISLMLETLLILGYIDINTLGINRDEFEKKDCADVFFFVEINKNKIVNCIKDSLINTML